MCRSYLFIFVNRYKNEAFLQIKTSAYQSFSLLG